MNTYQHFVGIDISKAWIDVAIFHPQLPQRKLHYQFDQSKQGYAKLKQWILQQGVAWDQNTLFCMEHTGLYNQNILAFLADNKLHVWVEMAIKIKKSSGLQRTKTDKADAQQIAQYAFRFQDKAIRWIPVDTLLQQLKNLLAQRDRLVTAHERLIVPIQEIKQTGLKKQAQQLNNHQKKVINALKQAITKIDDSIQQTIKQNDQLNRQVAIVSSIKGIGTITAAYMVAYTNAFTSFQTGKQLACYSGVVPFQKDSGSSIHFKTRLSPFANKKLKTLLHLCALSAIRYDKELKTYYQRKVEQGKNKMSVINAVRNKLALRIAAVVRDDRMFEDNYQYKVA